MNVTIHDFEEAKKHEEIEDAYTSTNPKYKTSLVYGAKICSYVCALKNFCETDQANCYRQRNQICKHTIHIYILSQIERENFWEK